ncbi:sec-independent protein translocase protein TatC [Parafrankia irregularis]|uniref:Sec-independent protein translocase protein TatC n=1 Tax=Parafrankia irregularis TaxID=795642 RepID=A0A0S4QTW2_9ACTN|nr:MULTISPECIES: twin-arginine translocase subunit TatC [Parafrankia]MBE3201800.1 twin-arginine translocase subunit TatC [Parafrankia sp. CH37]CUU58280.1 sec-independent protein translocase protein TatC [Parafrankia irregularis]
MPRLPTPRTLASSVNQRRTRTVEDSRMPLTEHLRELRNRLAKALLAFGVASIICFIWEPNIFQWLIDPYCSLPADKRGDFGGADGSCNLYFFGILDAFTIRLKISMLSGAVFSAPIWLYQLWSFITPGLHRNERRWSLTFVLASLVLFAAGGFFAYITLQTGLKLLLGFGGDGLVSVLDGSKYLSYVFAMLLVFGLSFEVPLLITMLNLAGLVTTAKLRSWRRAEIFLVFVFAAVVTPSQDPFTMLALGLPMIFLYEVALIIGWVNDRRKIRRGDTSPYADLADDEVSPLDFDDTRADRATSTGSRGGGAAAGSGSGLNVDTVVAGAAGASPADNLHGDVT